MTDKVSKSEQKLINAFSSVSDTIVKNAKMLKHGECDTKKLKELTSIAKELYGIVKETPCSDTLEEDEKISVVFLGDSDKWAD